MRTFRVRMRLARVYPLALLAAACSWGSSRADFTLTPAGEALGFGVTTFATGFPSAYGVGPLGLAFLPSGGVLVTDYPGNIRLFPSDADNQVAPPPVHFYGFGNAHGLAESGGLIYMTQKFAGDLVQINPDGSFNHKVVSGLNTPLAVVADPANGHLFVSTAAGIMDVDPIARTATTLVHRSADGLTVAPDGSIVYGEINAHILGFSTATGRQVFDSGSLGGGPDGTALGFGTLAGNIFANDNNGSFVEINLTTLARTVIGTGGSRGDFVQVDPNNGSLLLTQTDRVLRLTPGTGGGFGPPTPEPPAIVLLGLGLVGLAGWHRLRSSPAAVSIPIGGRSTS